MTNAERYKSPEDRIKAFESYCNTTFQENKTYDMAFRWLEMEHERDGKNVLSRSYKGTILDNEDFCKALKKRCAEQGILETLYESAVVLGNRVTWVDGDFADGVFNAVYSALEDIGLTDADMRSNVYPSDFVEITYDGSINEIEVVFKPCTIIITKGEKTK